MTSKKTTRRALFSSIVSLILCCSMLVGTTFAWFTDSVESVNNVITAGNLDVEVTVDGVDISKQAALFQDILWEPGALAYENLTVTNAGTLALKYQMAMTFKTDGVAKNGKTLADALKLAVVPGGFSGDRAAAMQLAYNYTLSDFVLQGTLEEQSDNDVYGLVIYWEPSDSDNEYNMNNNNKGTELSITLGVNVFATQLVAEEDSFGPEYDANAPMPDWTPETNTTMANVNADGSASILSSVAPSATTNQTTIDAPAGAFDPTDKVEVEVETTNTLFKVTDAAGGVVASLDVTMTVNGEETSVDLEDGTVYTVTTYISKGLNVTDVEYVGTDNKDQPTFVSYDATTGKLVFTTNHFSEYHVIANRSLAYDATNDTALNSAQQIVDASKNEDAVVVIPENNKDEVNEQIQAGVANGEISADDAADVYAAKIGETGYLTLPSAFAAAVDGDTITLLKNVQIDADTTIAIANGTGITLDLNSNTLSGVADGTGNREMFLVKGNLTVKNGTVLMAATVNQGWNAMSTIFDVTAGGVLNINDATIENLGGTDMAFCVHLNNWGEVTLNAENVKFRSPYVGIRAFNSGYDMNNVTLKKCDILTGNSCFWVHNYTEADFGSAEKAAAAAERLNFTFEDVTIARTNGSKSLVRFGMTNAIYYSDIALTEVVAGNADALVYALENNKNVLFNNDLKIDPANMSNAYGTTGINVKNGQAIDGNGYTLDVQGAGGTWDSGINTTGGTIKNITVTGSFRGIFINHNSTHSETVVLENVIIDGTVYTISCDQGMNQNLEAIGCTFNGWTSYAATLGTATFTNCNFGEGSGYAYCRPYAPTTFVGCNFEAGFEMDAVAAVSLVNCYLDGVLITAENVGDLVTGNTANATVNNQ